MVALSLTISICRGSGQKSSTPSLEYQSSICSSHSCAQQPLAYGYHLGQDNSLEELVSKQRPEVTNSHHRHRATVLNAKARMMGETGAANVDRKKSFGRGGAGNIRRPSDVIYPPKTGADGRRRSSVWPTTPVSASPGTNPAWRRFSVLGLLRKRSVQAEEIGTDSDKEGKIEFKEVDMGRES
ncbi:hypothetical protein VTL71DRAFT_11766 [Oculimacula yallundae]|uniref:Uncharacterized protein n=1 Tax=Oculimacula yallundae TaxID=86028 RepID=A0ABR4CR01_9HELO